MNFKLIEDVNSIYSKKIDIKERNLSILEFNQRVLKMANVESFPLMERLNFISIVFSNLDEFIEVRLANNSSDNQEIYIRMIENIYNDSAKYLMDILKNNNLNYHLYNYSDNINMKKIKDKGLYYAYMNTNGCWRMIPYSGQSNVESSGFFVRFISDKSFRYVYTGGSVSEIEDEIMDMIELKKGYSFNFIQISCNNEKIIKSFLKDMNMESMIPIIVNDLIIKSNYIIDDLKKDNKDSMLYFSDQSNLVKQIDYYEELQKKDIMIHSPYDSYDYVLNFIDNMCNLSNIKIVCITLYRIAHNSKIIESLINARKSGKEVFVYIEPTARGNEEDNIHNIRLLAENGVHIKTNYFNYKVHSKLFCAISDNGTIFTHVGTGNYNESTAKVYTDFHLMTTDPAITTEVFNIFKALFTDTIKINDNKSSSLYSSPFNFRRKILSLINREKIKGSSGKIYIKCNSLCDCEIIYALYNAAEAGVHLKIICRTGCSIKTHPNIIIKSKVGRYLEHDRFYIFGDDVYISSADLLLRNLSKRVEILCKINVRENQINILKYFNSLWNSELTFCLMDDNTWKQQKKSL